ncbi:MAG TPA: SET domain-containing protein [Halalkalibaculum sp.]|nr:SET domain-containing protein [Halalkalibaculum sp.]
MIHPDTELKVVDQKRGRGIFATEQIPKGTITYVKDPLEIEIEPGDPRLQNADIKDEIETYTYINENGTRILSWDNAKYVNHCCHCNTMSTGYGFEIAICDINAGEEITDEYGMFNFDYTLELSCKKADCRKTVSGSDLETKYREWDSKVRSALKCINAVNQPLITLLDEQTRKNLQKYLDSGKEYCSVLNLRFTQK